MLKVFFSLNQVSSINLDFLFGLRLMLVVTATIAISVLGMIIQLVSAASPRLLLCDC
jgi:hypothetical protein